MASRMFLLLSLTAFGCSRGVRESRDATPYSPLYAAGAFRTFTGPKADAYRWASDAGQTNEAARRWQTFLADYYPPERELEDGPDIYMRETARYELMRLHYLAGRVSEGDRVLAQLDPLDLGLKRRFGTLSNQRMQTGAAVNGDGGEQGSE